MVILHIHEVGTFLFAVVYLHLPVVLTVTERQRVLSSGWLKTFACSFTQRKHKFERKSRIASKWVGVQRSGF